MPEHLVLATHQELRGELAAAAFTTVALRERLDHLRRVTFPSGPLTLEQLMPLGDVELAEQVEDRVSVLLRIEPTMIVHVTAHRGLGEVHVAGRERAAVDDVAESLVAVLRDDRGDDDIPITFWTATLGGVLTARRRLDAPPWGAIAANYAAPARAGLGALMAATEPGPGRLLLFHGEPGTGKSFALRALAREWAPWCETHFIADPDVLLGSRSSHVVHALMREPRPAEGSTPWRLLVLEDAGELLAADARARVGQALSRLLNITDGLLGEGLQTLVVVTTNEPLRRLHDAVVRPGRCWAQVEFGPLAAPEADAWLAARGARPAGRAGTLAELFALAGGRAVPARQALGFAVA